jgi:hypothetical protein
MTTGVPVEPELMCISRRSRRSAQSIPSGYWTRKSSFGNFDVGGLQAGLVHLLSVVGAALESPLDQFAQAGQLVAGQFIARHRLGLLIPKCCHSHLKKSVGPA